LKKRLMVGYLAGLFVFAVFAAIFYLRMETTARGATTIVLLGAALSFIIFSWIFYLLNREMAEKEKAEEDLEKANKLIQEELARVKLLTEISAAASSALGIKEVCDRVLDETRLLLKARMGSVYYLDEKENALKHLSHFGYPEKVKAAIERLPLEIEGDFVKVVKYNIPLITHEGPHAPITLQRIKAAGVEKNRWCALPIIVKGKAVGLFALVFDEMRPFTEDEASLYRGIAEQLAVALENARLFEAESRRKKELERLSYKYELILKSAGEGILGLDANGNHTFVNNAALDMLGYAAEELIGKHSHPIWHHTRADGGPYPEEECNIYYTVRMGHVNQINDEVFWRKDGTSFPVEYTSTPIYEEGRIAGAVVTFRDITWRKSAEDALRESEESFKSIYEKSPIGIELYNEQGRLIDANQASMDIFGVSGREKAFAYSLFDDPNLPGDLRERLEGGEIANIEIAYDFEGIKKTGLYRTKREGVLELSVLFTPLIPETRKTKTPSGYLLQIQDITDRKRALAELQKANQDLSKWLNEVEQRNREIELLGRMTSLLQACSTAGEAYSVVGRLASEIFSAESGAIYLLDPDRNLLDPIAGWGEKEGRGQVFTPHECWALRLGRSYLVENPDTGMNCLHVFKKPEAGYLCIPMIAQGETIGMIHMEFSTHLFTLPPEIRERTRANKERLGSAVGESIALSLANFRLRESLFNQSIHDPLTGLFNRRYMSELLERELHRAGRRGLPLSLIMLDLDNFKKINDRFGHEAGDAVLKEIGNFLSRKVRGEDFACRYGGEEFLLILPETDSETAGDRAEELRQDVKAVSVPYRGESLNSLTLSLGVAEFPRNGITAGELVRAADSALYRAKEEGRDRVVSL